MLTSEYLDLNVIQTRCLFLLYQCLYTHTCLHGQTQSSTWIHKHNKIPLTGFVTVQQSIYRVRESSVLCTVTFSPNTHEMYLDLSPRSEVASHVPSHSAGRDWQTAEGFQVMFHSFGGLDSCCTHFSSVCMYVWALCGCPCILWCTTVHVIHVCNASSLLAPDSSLKPNSFPCSIRLRVCSFEYALQVKSLDSCNAHQRRGWSLAAWRSGQIVPPFLWHNKSRREEQKGEWQQQLSAGSESLRGRLKEEGITQKTKWTSGVE